MTILFVLLHAAPPIFFTQLKRQATTVTILKMGVVIGGHNNYGYIIIRKQLNCVKLIRKRHRVLLPFLSPTLTVPAPVCDAAPVSDDGVIAVTWDYTHTGGLNLTEVIVQYGIYSADEIDFQDIPDGNLTDVDEVTLDVGGLVAGRAYVFQITATNDVGSATVQCPPVVHTVGKPLSMSQQTLELQPYCMLASNPGLPRTFFAAEKLCVEGLGLRLTACATTVEPLLKNTPELRTPLY